MADMYEPELHDKGTVWRTPTGERILLDKASTIEDARRAHVELLAGPPTLGGTVSKGYGKLVKPVTQAASAGFDMLTEPLVAWERATQGESPRQIFDSYNVKPGTTLIEYACMENNRAFYEGRIKPFIPPDDVN